LKHYASPDFWACYRTLPEEVRKVADEAFERLKRNPHHPSLHFKKVGRYRSARVGSSYRALAIEAAGDLVWFWIGSHADYDKLLG
jgi:hypothetical protein